MWQTDRELTDRCMIKGCDRHVDIKANNMWLIVRDMTDSERTN